LDAITRYSLAWLTSVLKMEVTCSSKTCNYSQEYTVSVRRNHSLYFHDRKPEVSQIHSLPNWMVFLRRCVIVNICKSNYISC
jgi:hypothetical protein